MNRIDVTFEELKKNGTKAIIPYVTAGDPNIQKTEEIIIALEEAGANIVEIGIPYSDPLADGPVIENAGLRSINNGFKLADAFGCVKNIRKKSQIPLVFVVYYNTIFGYGRERFVKECVECGVDALIVPDLPKEESDEITGYLENTGIYLIPFVAITSRQRIPKLVENAKGFIYCVSSFAVTYDEEVLEFLKEVKKYTDLPVCVGFGISKKEDVEKFGKVADGCIIASAIVKKIYDSNADVVQIKEFVGSLR